jgi:hypothetical protein
MEYGGLPPLSPKLNAGQQNDPGEARLARPVFGVASNPAQSKIAGIFKKRGLRAEHGGDFPPAI